MTPRTTRLIRGGLLAGIGRPGRGGDPQPEPVPCAATRHGISAAGGGVADHGHAHGGLLPLPHGDGGDEVLRAREVLHGQGRRGDAPPGRGGAVHVHGPGQAGDDDDHRRRVDLHPDPAEGRLPRQRARGDGGRLRARHRIAGLPRGQEPVADRGPRAVPAQGPRGLGDGGGLRRGGAAPRDAGRRRPEAPGPGQPAHGHQERPRRLRAPRKACCSSSTTSRSCRAATA